MMIYDKMRCRCRCRFLAQNTSACGIATPPARKVYLRRLDTYACRSRYLSMPLAVTPTKLLGHEPIGEIPRYRAGRTGLSPRRYFAQARSPLKALDLSRISSMPKVGKYHPRPASLFSAHQVYGMARVVVANAMSDDAELRCVIKTPFYLVLYRRMGCRLP